MGKIKRCTKSMGNILAKRIVADEKLIEFVRNTLVCKKNPIYSPVKLVFSRTDKKEPGTEVFLPPLEIPILPTEYSEALFNTGNRTPRIKKRRRSTYEKLNNQKKSEFPTLDGVPYNPQEFKFPTSQSEKQKLGKLAVLLELEGFTEKTQTKKTSAMDVLKRERLDKGNKKINKINSSDRLRVINQDPHYKAQLSEWVENKIGRDTKSGTITSGFFKTSGILNKDTEYGNPKSIREDRIKMRNFT